MKKTVKRKKSNTLTGFLVSISHVVQSSPVQSTVQVLHTPHARAVVGHKSTGITEEDNGLFNVFWAISFLAREDLAILKLDALCSLIQVCGADMLTYGNACSGNEMLHCLATVRLNCIIQSVQESPYFSILIDESTNVAATKQLIMYLRYMTSSGPATHFVCIL